MTDQKPVVFVHVPKTAGTSLIELVSRNFRASEIYRIENTLRPASQIADDIEVALQQGKRFICGHFPFSAVARVLHDVTVFTLVRDPVKRIVSLYHFWQSMDPTAGSEASRFVCRFARSVTLEEFVASDHPLIVSATRNEMCKALANQTFPQPSAIDPASIYLEARHTLEHVAFGLVERLDESLFLLSHKLSLNLLDEVHLNSGKSVRSSDLTEQTRTTILNANLADAMLYRHAERVFERQVAAVKIETLFSAIGEQALTTMVPDEAGGFRWDASLPLAGSGWNDREAAGDGSYWRFMSAPETIIYLPNRRHGERFMIVVEVLFFHREGLLDKIGTVDGDQSMKFNVNGIAVEFKSRPFFDSGVVFNIEVNKERSV